MNSEREFEKNMKQLLQLLKKIVSHHPGSFAKQDFESLMKSKGNMNVFFLNFFPMTSEELDEIDEILDQAEAQEAVAENLDYELSSEDERFLKDHGIRF